ncbi:hypothetical protein [Burkholderia phage FLC9]|nr:hypothetical protein [Burkholderia phage FLC9]
MLELADYIQAVEAAAGSFMLPNPEGLFMAGQCEPVLYRDRKYFYAGRATGPTGDVAEAIPFNWNQPILGDVLDHKGDLVLVHKQASLLSDKPLWSLRSRNMIVDLIDHIVQNHARWSGSQQMPKVGPKQTNLYGVIRPFLLEQFQRSGISIEGAVNTQEIEYVRGRARTMKHKHHVEIDLVSEQEKQFFYMGIDICDSILLQLNDLFQQLLEFLGTDRWIMHFSKVSNTQMTVEKTIDYRIYSWMLEHGRGYDD